MKRQTLRTLLLAAFALCCAQGLRAQEPCRIERAAAPDFGGVMLGMRLEELRRMFPGSEELRAEPGDAAKPFVASLGMLELGVRREEFRGVQEFVLTFVGGAVRRIDVRFRQPAPWSAVDEFSAQASKRLALPADSWVTPASDAAKHSRVLDCAGFSVEVRFEKGGPNTLSIVDTTKADAADASKAGADGAGAATVPTPTKRRPRKKQRGASTRRPPANGTDGKDERLEKESQ